MKCRIKCFTVISDKNIENSGARADVWILAQIFNFLSQTEKKNAFVFQHKIFKLTHVPK